MVRSPDSDEKMICNEDVLSDDRNGDASLVVSLEINGINYQGVLFAQAAQQAAAKIRSS